MAMRMREDIGAIAFDLDGTLVDSAPDIAHALNTAFAAAGLATFELPQVRCWVGDGPDVLPGLILLKGSVVVAMWHYNDLPAFEGVKEKYLK